MRLLLAITMFLFMIVASVSAETDFAQRYPATLDHSEGQPPRAWTATEEDIWRLRSFRFEFDDKIAVECGSAQVVFGVFERNVLWAAVFPDQPGSLTATSLDAKTDVTSIWLRFNPRRVSELFPAETIEGRGTKQMLIWAKRLCAWKMRSGWQANNLPVVPMMNSIIVDIDTAANARRYFVINTEVKSVELVQAFNQRALPPLTPCDASQSLRVFDAVWESFDREYAKFVIRPEVNWKQLRDRYRDAAAKAETTYECAAAVAEMLEHLRDLHIAVRVGEEFVPCFNRPRFLNASLPACKRAFAHWNETRSDIIWARTDDSIGYINIHVLRSASAPAAFDEILEKLADTWGLIIDLRFNGGGDELLAREMAGRLVDERRIYSLNQYRNGPEHSDLGPMLERAVEPRGSWLYAAPVIVLWGQHTMSSAESFALMLAQCPQVTTMGDRTAGSSGNPRVLELEGNITVTLPRWIDFDPQGNSIEDSGVEPEIRIEAKPEDFTPTIDPVLVRALDLLRKTPEQDRRRGKR